MIELALTIMEKLFYTWDEQFDDTNKMFVKRVIGVPGDVVQIDNGIVYLNNEKLLETLQKLYEEKRNLTAS